MQRHGNMAAVTPLQFFARHLVHGLNVVGDQMAEA